VSVAEDRVAFAKQPLHVVKPAEGPVWQRRYKLALVVTDVLVIILALAAAQLVKLGRPDGAAATNEVYYSVLSYYTVLSMYVAAVWLALLAAYRTRSPRIVGAGVEEYRRVFSATLATVGVIAVALMIFRPNMRVAISRSHFRLDWWGCCSVAACAAGSRVSA